MGKHLDDLAAAVPARDDPLAVVAPLEVVDAAGDSLHLGLEVLVDAPNADFSRLEMGPGRSTLSLSVRTHDVCSENGTKRVISYRLAPLGPATGARPVVVVTSLQHRCCHSAQRFTHRIA